MSSGLIGPGNPGSGGFVGAGGAGGAGGLFASVALLLHMEGTDGAQVFVDSSSYAHTMSGQNLSSTVTGTKKFGTSAFSSGAVGMVTTSYADTGNAEFQIVDGKDFTIEAFYRQALAPDSSAAPIFVMTHADLWATFEMYSEVTTGKLVATVFTSGPAPIVTLKSAGSVCDDAWHHCAFVREGTTYSLYLDGTRVATDTQAGTVGSTHGYVAVGRNPPGSEAMSNGFVDELRFVNGVAVYSGATCDVPTGAFPDA